MYTTDSIRASLLEARSNRAYKRRPDSDDPRQDIAIDVIRSAILDCGGFDGLGNRTLNTSTTEMAHGFIFSESFSHKELRLFWCGVAKVDETWVQEVTQKMLDTIH